MDWVTKIFVNFCLMIDKMLYSINSLLFDLFVDVAQARFDKSFFDNLLNNLYVIIGVFMVFRVAFSLIQMLANPDLLSDKEKGAGKLATRIVIAFALIIMVPTIFDYAYNLQAAVLQDNILGRLILGDYGAESNTASNKGFIASQGAQMSMQIFKGMISMGVDDSNDNAHKCACALGTKDKDDGCSDDLVTENFKTIDSLRKVDGVDCFTETDNNNTPIYDYKPLVSSIALGMVVWLMVGFCIDIGVRLVKLAFLQLIAPICIVTYVGGGKDNSFNKWLKMTISAYVSMFVKLIIIYFVIYVAAYADMKSLGLNGLGYVLVILGLLVFAKNAPKLIGDLFGIQMDQESGFKGIAKTALLGGAALAAGGGVAGLSNAFRGLGNMKNAVSDAGGWNALKSGNKDAWKALGGGALGTLGSTIAGTTAGAFYGAKNGFGKNATLGGSINKALMTSNAKREQRADRSSIGYGVGSRVGDFFKGAAGMDTTAKEGAIRAKNRLAGLQSSRQVLAHNQFENSKNLHPDILANLSQYTYDAKDKKWMDASGNNISEIDMYAQFTNTDKSNYVRADGTFDEATYNQHVESEMKNRYSDEYNYLSETRKISELDGDIIKAENEVKKWETEQNAVERKTSSGNK